MGRQSSDSEVSPLRELMLWALYSQLALKADYNTFENGTLKKKECCPCTANNGTRDSSLAGKGERIFVNGPLFCCTQPLKDLV